MISIIIPTYNSADTLERCIKSILNQNYSNFEILIIDGLSTDLTSTIAQSFTDDRLRFFAEKDKGIYDAMNKGIAKAVGEYLLFLGSDDSLFDTNVLINVVKKIGKRVDGIFYGNVKMNGKSSWIKDGSIYGGAFDLKRLFNFNIPHQAILYHKSIFNKLGLFNINYPLLADHDFILRAAASNDLIYIDELIANFSLGGASGKATDKQFEKDKLKNIITYFRKKIHSSAFVDLRFFVQQAAFKHSTGISLGTRIYCILVYAKLKAQSLFS